VRHAVLAALALAACAPDEGTVRHAPLSPLAPPALGQTPTEPGTTPSTSTDPTPDTGTPPVDTGTTPTTPTSTTGTDALIGFVGSPCQTDADCPYDGGVCLLDAEGFPRGTCSSSCDQFCPDDAGYPTTFCATIDELPPSVASLGDGGCLSRCDFEAYPFTGCRLDYGCVPASRANEPQTSTYVCMPDVPSALSSCMQDLADRGVPFTPTIIADASPAEAPSLTCHVEEPITFRSGYLGIDIIYYNGTTPGSVDGACELGRALADTLEDVEGEGVTVVRHLGTTVCRTIAGTQTLSRHAYGDAIDLYGYDFANGDAWTYVSDWDHDTTSPGSTAGAWLYDRVYGWHDQQLWTILLTPNYNAAHDNHVHADLTPGSDFIGFQGPFYIGPNLTGE
jgi:hypothetical protein